MAGLKLQNIVKRFGQIEVIHGVSLQIEDGEFVVFVGPSGCGKSTMLRIIAGLEEATEGEVWIGGRQVNDVDPANRGVAMVFQTYALYPHMSVEENMGFGLRMAKRPKHEIKERVARAAEILQLSPYLKRRPKELSGGPTAARSHWSGDRPRTGSFPFRRAALESRCGTPGANAD